MSRSCLEVFRRLPMLARRLTKISEVHWSSQKTNRGVICHIPFRIWSWFIVRKYAHNFGEYTSFRTFKASLVPIAIHELYSRSCDSLYQWICNQRKHRNNCFQKLKTPAKEVTNWGETKVASMVKLSSRIRRTATHFYKMYCQIKFTMFIKTAENSGNFKQVQTQWTCRLTPGDCIRSPAFYVVF